MAARRALCTSNSSGATLPLHRMSVSITSWFQLPDQGMMRYEMLSRGTAFCVHPPAGKGGSTSPVEAANVPLYFFTCSHVTAPWRWPKLYPLPWLEYVKDEHTLCTLHVTDGRRGPVVKRFLLQPTVVHHDSLDVCVLRLQNQEYAIRQMAKYGLRLEPLVLGSNVPAPGHPVVSPGFAVEREGKGIGSAHDNNYDNNTAGILEDSDTGKTVHLDLKADEEPRRLCVSMGTVNKYKDRHSRGFAVMDRELGDGMCGAPLLDLRDEGRCIGLVEGIAPPMEEEKKKEEVEGMEPTVRKALEVRRAIAGNAAFIYGRELVDLLAKASSSTQ